MYAWVAMFMAETWLADLAAHRFDDKAARQLVELFWLGNKLSRLEAR